MDVNMGFESDVGLWDIGMLMSNAREGLFFQFQVFIYFLNLSSLSYISITSQEIPQRE